MKTILLLTALLFSVTTFSYDWSFADLEFCASYDKDSYNSELDFDVKCVDESESIVYLEDYLSRDD